MTPEEFLQRARGDEANRFSSMNTETFLRNERLHLAHHRSARWAAAGGDACRTGAAQGAARTATSPNLTLTEWFTRLDPDMVEYKYRIDDPTVYTAPYTVRMMLTTQPNYHVMEYSCHEGSSAVEMGLKGERAYERSVEQAKAKGLPIPERMPRNMDVYTGRAAVPVREIGFETR